MAAFQFPDPALETTVVNPITGSTYQWKEPPGKWVVTVKMRDVGDIIWEGDSPPDPIGDYKLWYSTDTLELYFYYCDAGGTCAWVPTSAPITMLEDLDNTVFELRTDLTSVNLAVRENENAIGRTVYFSDSPPAIYDDIDSGNELADGTPIMVPNELNYKFWYDTDRLELLVLYKDPDDGVYSYVPVSLPLTNLDLDALNTQVQANSYSNNQQSQAIVVLEDLIVALQNQVNALNDLTEPNEDIYSGVLYIPFTNDQTIYPLELIEKGAGWTGGGVTSQLMYDVPDKPIHIGFRANQVTMPQFDIGLAIRFTHTSGVMYGRIKTAWHSGQVHLNIEEQVGDPFVAGEFVTEIALQDSKFVERAGDTMIGDLKFEGTNKVVTRHIDSGQNSNLELKHNGTTRIFVGGSAVSVNNSLIVKNANAEAEDLIFKVEGNQANDGTGDNVLYVQRKTSGGDQLRYYGPVTFNKEVTTKEYVDSVIPFVPLPTSLQLGAYQYRRAGDGWGEGTIQSNTTTDPGQISQLKVHFKNKDGFDFGAAYLQEAVREKMFITVYDGSNYYQGRITGVTADNKGVILTLNYIQSAGTFYYNNTYWVSISINKHDTPIN